MDIMALWKRPSVQAMLWYCIGSFMTWAAMTGYQAMQNRCQTYVVKFRILGGQGQADAYITTTNESFYSFKEYKAGEEVCL